MNDSQNQVPEKMRRLWDERVEFNPVRPQLATIRIITTSLLMVFPIVGVIVVLVLEWGELQLLWRILLGVALGGLILVYLWLVWLIRRQVRAFGWGLTDTDLHVRRGIMMSSLTVIPLERLQYVDLEQGPLDRIFNLASVTLHTASASTDASIPGLDPETAAQLRRRLSEHTGVELSGI